MQQSRKWVLKYKSIAWSCQPTHSRRQNRTSVLSTSKQIPNEQLLPDGVQEAQNLSQTSKLGNPAMWQLRSAETAANNPTVQTE